MHAFSIYTTNRKSFCKSTIGSHVLYIYSIMFEVRYDGFYNSGICGGAINPFCRFIQANMLYVYNVCRTRHKLMHVKNKVRTKAFCVMSYSYRKLASRKSLNIEKRNYKLKYICHMSL